MTGSVASKHSWCSHVGLDTSSYEVRSSAAVPSLRATLKLAYLSHSDCGRHDTGWGHPEHVGRLRAIPRALREEPELFLAVRHLEGRHATDDELALAHDPGYVALVRDTALGGGGRFDTDTVVSEGSRDA